MESEYKKKGLLRMNDKLKRLEDIENEKRNEMQKQKQVTSKNIPELIHIFLTQINEMIDTIVDKDLSYDVKYVTIMKYKISIGVLCLFIAICIFISI